MATSWRGTLALLLVTATLLSAACATVDIGETIESLLRQIRELLAARRWDEALTRIAEVIRREPTEWRAYLYGAQAFMGKSDWTQALTSARKAFELAPREGEVVATLADSLLGAGRDALQRRSFADAASYLVEYVKLRPADWQSYLHAGRAFLGLGRWGDAARMLVDGLAHADPTGRAELTRAILDGGRQALAAGEYRGAATLLREYVRLDATSVAAYLDLGRASWNAGERSDALAAFRRVLELAPQNEEARRFLLGR